MILYHWTARRFVPPIRVHGIRIGAILVRERPLKFLKGYQWLTTNGLPNQEWAEGTGRYPYRRDEVRLTVQLPETERVLERVEWEALMHPETVRLLTEYGDPENWRVYHGVIRPAWIVKAVAKADLRKI